MGTTDITVRPGGSGGSTPYRTTVADARVRRKDVACLLEMGRPVWSAGHRAGGHRRRHHVKADPAKRVTYGELIGGKRSTSR